MTRKKQITIIKMMIKVNINIKLKGMKLKKKQFKTKYIQQSKV